VKKFEYKIFNMSEVDTANANKVASKVITWLDLLNGLGHFGWQVIERVTKTSYLMIREINDDSTKV
jgi:hypothetical protein